MQIYALPFGHFSVFFSQFFFCNFREKTCFSEKLQGFYIIDQKISNKILFFLVCFVNIFEAVSPTKDVLYFLFQNSNLYRYSYVQKHNVKSLYCRGHKNKSISQKITKIVLSRLYPDPDLDFSWIQKIRVHVGEGALNPDPDPEFSKFRSLVFKKTIWYIVKK